ncbi:kinesin-like protein KIF16B [Mytilus californianus]|uniref:kinesin-like protein KIF16B n=1 Tax=Mytilus californianus TaxID=6549 RepID=UPI002245BEC4|nr:kinesin-like protein KIF16B [Mytilus californianus]
MTSVKVAVRVRPFNNREIDLDSKFIVSMNGGKTTITNPKIPERNAEGGHAKDAMRIKDFTYDFSFWSVDKNEPKYCSQKQVFQCLGSDVVTSAYDGYNACVFAYGQTGSGKSYTMMGNPDDLGLIPRICQELFCRMREDDTNYRIEVSYMEIYNEKVRDLLKQSSNSKTVHNLRVREHPKDGPYVQDLSKHIVNNYEDVEELMHRGNSVRVTATTKMNDVSSRSHAIFTLVFTQAKFIDDLPCETTSKLHLVDLAGSENADASGATGQRLKEGGNINKSLVTLGTVISLLAKNCSLKEGKQVFIPYRDSKITWLLKDSIGGNARTIMIATISPADVNYGETLRTLRYANRAKNIINRPTVNEDPNVKLIRDLRAEISRLKALLGGSLDNIVTPKVQEKLHENEARVKVLTEEWAGKWNETGTILKNDMFAVRKEGLGVVLDFQLPHLIGIDDDICSTGIMLYHIKEGKTTVGRPDADVTPDIVLAGIEIEKDHCVIEYVNGDVILYPGTGALCVVNGVTQTSPTTLSQGAVILLGRTNMFRFNNPAEAAKMKKDLNNCGLSMSRSSLLSYSMTDLYTDSLSQSGYWWDDNENKLEEESIVDNNRNKLDDLEQMYIDSEREREVIIVQLEVELEEKRKQLDKIEQDFEQLRQQIDEQPSNSHREKMFQIDEELRDLETREKDIDEETRLAKEQLQMEIEDLQHDFEEKKSKVKDEVKELNENLQTLEKTYSDKVKQIKDKRDTVKTEQQQLYYQIETEEEELDELQNKVQEKRDSLVHDNPQLAQQLEEFDNAEKELKSIQKEIELTYKTKWNQELEHVTQENLKVEEAWKDIEENEEVVSHLLSRVDKLNVTERKSLEIKQASIQEAKILLKDEEKRLSEKEKNVLEQVEREMEKWEEAKNTEMSNLLNKRQKMIESGDVELTNLLQEMSEKSDKIHSYEKTLKSVRKTLDDADSEEEETKSQFEVAGKEIKNELSTLSKTLSCLDEEEDVEVSDMKSMLQQIEDYCNTEILGIQKDKDMMNKKHQDLCQLDEVGVSDNDQKIQEFEEMRRSYEITKQELDEIQKKYDEQRNSELDKIEFERLKLKELEHQQRINTLVEQEVKRRMFEEKILRENFRKKEKEKERIDRAAEIQKIKDMHNREIKQLKDKYEIPSTSSKSLMPSKSNPYVTSPDTGKQSQHNLRSRFSGSNISLSGSQMGDIPALSITIPAYRLQGYGSDEHYAYEVQIAVGDEKWTIYRRYSRFRDLHQEWKKHYLQIGGLVFPPRKLFRKQEKIAMDRQQQLEVYLKNALTILMRTPDCPLHPSKNLYLSKQILCDFDPFFKRGIFETSKHSTS